MQIKAGAHGKPIVALRRGAAPEIVADGVNSYLGHDLADLARLVPAAMTLDPATCRAHVATHFDRPVIARRQRAVYQLILDQVNDHQPLLAMGVGRPFSAN